MLVKMVVAFESPQWLWLLLATVPVLIAMRGRSAAWFAAVGVALLAVAAAGPVWHREVPPRVALMVDVSPSTRGTFWRDATALAQLRDQLGDSADVRLFTFADATAPRTQLSVPATFDAAVVMTDGRLDWIHAPVPLLFLVDPALDAPGDRAVKHLTVDADDVLIETTGPLSPNESQPSLAPDAAMVRIPSRPEAFTAQIAGDDPWPENDRLTLPPVLDRVGRRLAVGMSINGFKSIEPAELAGAAELADASVLVVDTRSIDNLPNRAAAVRAFVRDYGGLLILVGTESPGVLAAISPLSLVPPEPRANWVLLVDSSGSMAANTGTAGQSRFDLATAALLEATAALPATTRVEVADFSANLRWWTRDATAGQVTTTIIPPDAQPGGETNLAAALERVAAEASSEQPTQVLLLSDAEAAVPPELADVLSAADVTPNLLAIGGRVDESVRDLIHRTGGRLISEIDPTRWRSAAQSLTQSVAGGTVSSTPTTLRWRGELAGLGNHEVTPWRPAWVKESAQTLAESDDGARVATWRIGGGRIVAASAELDAPTLQAIADTFAGEADDAVTIDWTDGEALIADIVAPGASHVELRRDGTIVQAVQLTPNRWRTSITGERPPAIATVLVDGRVAERRATAGRYAPEFERIGNNTPRMLALAKATGGAVAARLEDLPLPRRRERVGLASIVALFGALSIGAAVAVLTRRGLATGR